MISSQATTRFSRYAPVLRMGADTSKAYFRRPFLAGRSSVHGVSRCCGGGKPARPACPAWNRLSPHSARHLLLLCVSGAAPVPAVRSGGRPRLSFSERPCRLIASACLLVAMKVCDAHETSLRSGAACCGKMRHVNSDFLLLFRPSNHMRLETTRSTLRVMRGNMRDLMTIKCRLSFNVTVPCCRPAEVGV
jgi:hypothetical protein